MKIVIRQALSELLNQIHVQTVMSSEHLTITPEEAIHLQVIVDHRVVHEALRPVTKDHHQVVVVPGILLEVVVHHQVEAHQVEALHLDVVHQADQVVEERGKI